MRPGKSIPKRSGAHPIRTISGHGIAAERIGPLTIMSSARNPSLAAALPGQLQEDAMGSANYKISGGPGEWHVEHEGKVASTYATKESAFEAAAAAASMALREGNAIMITAPGSDGGRQTTTGARE
jgi:hypothetical protein